MVNVYVNGCAYEFPREKIDRLEDQGAIMKADMVGQEDQEAYVLCQNHMFTVQQVMMLMGEDA